MPLNLRSDDPIRDPRDPISGRSDFHKKRVLLVDAQSHLVQSRACRDVLSRRRPFIAFARESSHQPEIERQNGRGAGVYQPEECSERRRRREARRTPAAIGATNDVLDQALARARHHALQQRARTRLSLLRALPHRLLLALLPIARHRRAPLLLRRLPPLLLLLRRRRQRSTRRTSRRCAPSGRCAPSSSARGRSCSAPSRRRSTT
mmetsp:Transcript_53038/g.93546  ORF Transcript_53038/g.93546 Transcript_53038/m.93546 type:complete len:206 (+) Transcript_53038:175-792(+)